MSLEMPNGFSEPETRRESLTSIRTRDIKTGRFVGAPTLIAKGALNDKWHSYRANALNTRVQNRQRAERRYVQGSGDKMNPQQKLKFNTKNESLRLKAVAHQSRIAKNKWLDRFSDTVLTAADARELKRKKRVLKRTKMDPNISVTLKKKGQRP